MTRRIVLHFALSLLSAAMLIAGGRSASAQQTYPSKAIRFLVGAPPGGSNDLFARAIGQQMQQAIGRASCRERVCQYV